MTTRIALISDIHANALALRAVLADIGKTGADRLICLGDVATLGPEPQAVIEILSGLDCPCILGNHDEYLLNPDSLRGYTESAGVIASIDWCRRRLSAADFGFLRGFQRGAEIPLGRTSMLRVFHGSPRSNAENILGSTPPDDLDAMLVGHTATVLAGGHTHVQMLRQHHGLLLVNPGSVGLAFKDYVDGRSPTVLPHAEYAIVEEVDGIIEVRLRRVPLDRSMLCREQEKTEHPLGAWLLQQYAEAAL